MTLPRYYLDTTYGFHFEPDARYGDDAPEEVLEMSHPHWRNFPPVHPSIQHFFGLAFFFLWMISTFGNLAVFYLFIKVKTLRTPSNILVVTLALSDLCMINTMAPPVFGSAVFSKYWAFGRLACEWYGFLGGVFGVLSLLTIIVIGYDRYNVIVVGFKGPKMTVCKALSFVLLCSVYSTVVTILPLLHVWGAYNLEGMLLTCSFDYITDTFSNKLFTVAFSCGCYGVPLLLVIFFYSKIVSAVVAHERALRAQAKKMNVESLRSNENKEGDSAEVKIAKVAITNVSLWILAWTPYATVAFVGQFYAGSWLSPVVSQLPSFFAKTASVFNPIVYAVSHPKFREALAKECACLGIGKETESDQADAKTVQTKA